MLPERLAVASAAGAAAGVEEVAAAIATELQEADSKAPNPIPRSLAAVADRRVSARRIESVCLRPPIGRPEPESGSVDRVQLVDVVVRRWAKLIAFQEPD